MAARQRLTFAAIAVVIAIVAVIALTAGGGDDEPEQASSPTQAASETTPEPTAEATTEATAEPTPEPTATPKPKPQVTRVRVRGGEPVGGVKEIEVDEGERIRFTVTSDVSDHVHLHGYDIMKDVGPGQDAEFNVPATITGIFEAELEDRGVQIVSVRVNP